MNDERVIVNKGLLDNIANPLMQAIETTDNLSLPEMATAAQMMLPSKWELVVDTTIEGNISMFMQEIPNADEVAIEISLGRYDSADNWREVTPEEKAEIEKQQQAEVMI